MLTAATDQNAAQAILAQQVKAHGEGGQRKVCEELGYSTAVISQYLNGKYPGDVSKLEKTIITIYGEGGLVACPERGPVTPSECARTHKRSHTIGLKAGNPDTLRLYVACKKCPVRKGGN